jgi:23S rRNA (cytidine1920-2'-O)/16S rRNA (cytidine1409-2'-O)-methyltransferase
VTVGIKKPLIAGREKDAQPRMARAKPTRTRLDVWLVERGFAESREKAQAMILADRVKIRGHNRVKAGSIVREGMVVDVSAGPQRVGRGAHKLEAALKAFEIDPRGRIAMDIGASTGGFTEVLLTHGARRVYAVDVGRGQLHARLSSDPRVVLRDGVNARYLTAEIVPEVCSLAAMDVSFISVLKILPALVTVLSGDADIVVLVKPQFELSRSEVGRGGLVVNPESHAKAIRDVARKSQEDLGLGVVAACASPITGAEGNREFFLHLKCGGRPLPPESLEEKITRAVKET